MKTLREKRELRISEYRQIFNHNLSVIERLRDQNKHIKKTILELEALNRMELDA